MKKHWKYLKYVIRHKIFVFYAGLKTKAPIWRLLIHDWSKLTPAEWGPYAEYFHGINKHHWQYWILRNDDGSAMPLRMPKKYVREMVADWYGAGRAITGKWEAADWYEKNKDKIVLHPLTRADVRILLFKMSVKF